MPAARNLRLFTLYLACSLEGVCHGVYLVWLTAHRGVSPFAAAALLAAGDFALLVLEVPTGVFADRLGARRSLLLGSAFQILGLGLFWKAESLAWLAVGSLAIAFGDAFRHGADESLLYRSCAELGIAEQFGRRLASAEAWSLAVLVGLTALGGVIVDRVGFDAAWALELGLAVVGLALAAAMREPATTHRAADNESDDAPSPSGFGQPNPGAAARSPAWTRVPWALVVPATIAGAFASTGEFLAQTARPAARDVTWLAFAIAAAQLCEALGAGLVARGIVRIEKRSLDLAAAAALLAALAFAFGPALLLPALFVFGLADGVAHAVRSALVQQAAFDDERATIASAANAADMLGKTAALPAAAWLFARVALPGVASALVAAGLVGWAAAVMKPARPPRARRR
jgi:MFS family permease